MATESTIVTDGTPSDKITCFVSAMNIGDCFTWNNQQFIIVELLPAIMAHNMEGVCKAFLRDELIIPITEAMFLDVERVDAVSAADGIVHIMKTLGVSANEAAKAMKEMIKALNSDPFGVIQGKGDIA